MSISSTRAASSSRSCGATITADDVRDAVQQFLASDVLHYRKIIDIASPTSPLDDAAVQLMANLVLSESVSRPRGALAFVVSPGQAADNAETFARLTGAERPVKVFHSLARGAKMARRTADAMTAT